MDSLKQQNDEVLDKITKLDEKIKELDTKIIESKLCVEKLQSVEDKLDKFKALESETYNNDSLLGQLNCKVKAIENTLDEKDKIIKTLLEKIAVLEKRQDSIENETNEITELEQTFFNPSNCDERPLETTSEVNLGKHTEKPHVTNFQCDFCDFHAKNLIHSI